MHLEWLMGVPLPRPAALAARLEAPIEEWPYLDSEVLVKTRSRKVCMHPPTRVLSQHQRLSSSGIGSLHPGDADGGLIGKEHRERQHQQGSGSPWW